MDTTFDHLFSQFKVLTRSGIYTHVSLIEFEDGMKGKFNLNFKEQEIFWESYEKMIEENPETFPIHGIAECCPQNPEAYIPIIVDVDIKKEVKDSSEIKCLYTENEVISLIDIYQEQIQKFFVNINENNLVCFFS